MINKFRVIMRAIHLVRDKGIKSFINKAHEKWFHLSFSEPPFVPLTEQQLEEQKNKIFNIQPKISIVVPVYNTNPLFLEQMVDSVLNQTYSNFELCLYNGGSTEGDVEKVINHFMSKSDKIVHACSETNYGISENTNRALAMATGEYIGLLDHDDLLTPDALYECVDAINRYGADVIYSDEDKIVGNTLQHISVHKKPDWSPDTLLSYNYICHFLVFKASLLQSTGLFNSQFDGSQDYDFILRLTERAVCIHHIPKVLYHWRISENSTAASYSAKSYALQAGKDALQNYVSNRNESLIVNEGAFHGAFNITPVLNEMQTAALFCLGNWENTQSVKEYYASLNISSEYRMFDVVMMNFTPFHKDADSIAEQSSYYKVYDCGDKNVAEALNGLLKTSNADHAIILNADIRSLADDWYKILISEAIATESAVIAPKILNKKNKISSYGLAVNQKGIINLYHNINSSFFGYFGRLKIAQNITAISPELFLLKKDAYKYYGDFDEAYTTDLTIVDYCLRVNIHSGHVKLVNHELLYTRQSHSYSWPENEWEVMLEKYKDYLQDRDHYYPLDFLYKPVEL
ncbi:glycosyltransferase [Paenibacillus sp. FSL L8-0638]|uniref:glycosyltransferase family 2 protein n=1 Tax=Paenibacillus TaxID=44249 RepID=UPI003158929F